MPQVLNCVAGLNEKLGGESYRLELEHSAVDPQQQKKTKEDASSETETGLDSVVVTLPPFM